MLKLMVGYGSKQVNLGNDDLREEPSVERNTLLKVRIGKHEIEILNRTEDAKVKIQPT